MHNVQHAENCQPFQAGWSSCIQTAVDADAALACAVPYRTPSHVHHMPLALHVKEDAVGIAVVRVQASAAAGSSWQCTYHGGYIGSSTWRILGFTSASEVSTGAGSVICKHFL
jgi:hypothetical protein